MTAASMTDDSEHKHNAPSVESLRNRVFENTAKSSSDITAL